MGVDVAEDQDRQEEYRHEQEDVELLAMAVEPLVSTSSVGRVLDK